MSDVVVLFHGSSSGGPGCPDGWTAAWAAWRVHPDAKFIGVNHSKTDGKQSYPEGLEGKDVFILDFCYSRETLLEIKEISKSLLVIDHHASAQKDCEGLDFCIFDMTKSGAMLAWEYFHPPKDGDSYIPPLVSMISWRDLGGPWRGVKPPWDNAEAYLAAVDSYEKTFEKWEEIANLSGDRWKSLVNEGEAILRYQNKLVDIVYKNAHEMDFKGHKVKVINSPLFQSELGNRLSSDGTFGVVWNQGREGTKFSLRSLDKDGEEAFDVSEVCCSFPGGGGHRRASGFSRKAVDVEDLLDD